MHTLSIPTWIVHVSSVIEWILAIRLVSIYGQTTCDRRWFVLAWGMLPALISAMCALTWHFFDNAATLDWLVTLQAGMTVIGNTTLCLGAWWIWHGAQQLQSDDESVPPSPTS
ncbi:MAG: DUF2499 domain-containing protein [Cyanobacteria bacterium P01_H01_bin.15]